MRSYLSLLLILLTACMALGQIKNPKNIEQSWKTDTARHSVPLSDFTALLGRDNITPIDNPEFLNFSVADLQYLDNEPVIAVSINGEAHAYPLSLLMYHEIVNDEVGGKMIAITFCPLCHSAIVFDREVEINNEKLTLTFGTSGMLRNSDLVMWDRQTETWWQQFTGVGLVGSGMGVELMVLPSDLVSYYDFKHMYPGSRVLNYPFGESFKYGSNPYVEYDAEKNDHPSLFFKSPDKRLPATQRVVSVKGSTNYKIYPLPILEEKKVLYDTFEGMDLVFLFNEGMLSVMDKKKIEESKETGSVMVFNPVLDGGKIELTYWKDGKFKDKATESVWRYDGLCIRGERKGMQLQKIHTTVHFAFAWLEFYPESVIFGQE